MNKEQNMRKLTGALAPLALLGLTLAMAFFIPSASAQPKNTLKMSEKPLGKLGKAGEAQSMAVSGDNNHVAVLFKRSHPVAGGDAVDKYVVSVDGVDGKEYDWIVKSSLTMLSDNATVVYVVQQKDAQGQDQMFVVTGAKESTPYHEIVDSQVLVGPNGRYAFFAKKTGDSKRIIVIDGKESKEFDEIGSFSFSPDGKRAAYGVATAGQQVYIIDDTPGKAYDKIAGASFTWSLDSQHYAYAGIIGKDKDGKVIPVVDGKEEPATTAASRVVFSPDSQHFAYAASDLNKKTSVLLDAKAQKPYDAVVSETIRFSPDSTHLAYVVATGELGKPPKSMNVVLDGADQAPFDGVVAHTVRFSPDSKRLAYLAAKKGDKDKKTPDSLFYVVDGQEQRGYPNFPRDNRTGAILPSFLFSPDSKRFAYVAVSQQAAFVVVIDGNEGKDYEQLDPRTVQFSPDSKHFVYLGLRKGPDGVSRTYAVIDNSEGVPYASVANLMYNKDGSKLAYVAARVITENGKPTKVDQFVVVNNQEGTSYTAVLGDTMSFSPDGAHLAYEARRADKPFFVIDNEETPEHGGSLLGSRLVWDSPTTLHSIIKHDQDLSRMQVELPTAP
jgi:WD40 repeat protein